MFNVEFEEERKINEELEPLLSRPIEQNLADKYSIKQWLLRHLVKSPKAADAVMVAVVLINLSIIIYVMLKYFI